MKRTLSHSFQKHQGKLYSWLGEVLTPIVLCSTIFVKWYSELCAIVHQLRKKPIITTYAHTQEGNQLHPDSLTFSFFWVVINKSVCISFSLVTLQSAGLKRHFTSYIFHHFFIEHYTWSFSLPLFLSLSMYIHKIEGWKRKNVINRDELTK